MGIYGLGFGDATPIVENQKEKKKKINGKLDP